MTAGNLALSDPAVQAFLKAAMGFDVLSIFDLKMFNGSDPVTKIEGGKVLLTLPLSNIDPTLTYLVLHYDSNGNVTVLESSIKDGAIATSTADFSYFAIAVKTQTKPPVKPTTPPKTGV